jgi:hypothetical protein
MTGVTLRTIRVGLGLGLPAALIAHGALFGGQHAVGGAYHGVLVQATSTVALAFVALLWTCAWALSRNFSDGRVLAGRLRERLPSVGSVVASAAVWYLGIEALEPHHLSAPALAVFLGLAIASCFVLGLARAMADAFAHLAVTLARGSFSPRVPAWRRIPREPAVARRAHLARRRYARPPPIASTFSYA